MTNSKTNRTALGMNSEITRRDFLGSSLLASGTLLMGALTPADILANPTLALKTPADDWTGYGGVGEYACSNGNTWGIVSAGHRIRDNLDSPLPNDIIDTGEFVDCVIVGGGISGLAAALTFQRQTDSKKSCLILENHPIFGGEAKQNEFLVDGHTLLAPQGSALYFSPPPASSLAHFYNSIGLHSFKQNYQRWGGSKPEIPLSHNPYDTIGMEQDQYGFWFASANQATNQTTNQATTGTWVRNVLRDRFKDAPVAPEMRDQFSKWFASPTGDHSVFTPPKKEGDAISRLLDSITLEQHYMERYGVSREFIQTYLASVEGGESGLGPDALSAYADYAFDFLPVNEADGDDAAQMFPGGNATIARLMVKTLLPAAITGTATVEGVTKGVVQWAKLDDASSTTRIRLASTVISVQHDGDPTSASSLTIIYARDGKLYKVRARSAVMAGGCWTAKHIVKDLPEAHRNAYAQFYRSPCMIVNVAVRNWRFLYDQGLSGCRMFGGFASYIEVRKTALTGVTNPIISPDTPVVLTLKILYSSPGLSTQEQGIRGRSELIGTSYRDIEQRVREQLTAMFGAAGFNAKRDIAGIILNRWGHAYLSPQPGFFFGKDGQPAPREVLREAPFGRIAFANTDLAGAMDHRFSILEAQRAVDQLCGQVLSG